MKTQDGRTLRFYDDVMKGKILLINFFFTDCDAICPLMTENLARVQELLGDRVGTEIFMVVDLAAAGARHAGGAGRLRQDLWHRAGLVFLTGKKDDIELLRHRLGFVDIDPVVDADPEQHIGTVRIANEPMHRWAMSPALINPPALVRAVDRVVPKFS